uniref:Putative conserved plasma membrane protein n=1 Tax=Nyssomyia neivai TaxID=330878 RepID=A0A1L8D9T0_9DIPT
MRGSTAGLADGVLNPAKDAHGVLLDFLDTILSTLVVGPLVISYWRGTWNLMDLYLFPNDKILSASASLGIGVVGHLICTLFQDAFKHLHPNHHRITFYVISRLYTAIYGVICINGWRGGWQLIDAYTPTKVSTILLCTIIPAVCLALLKALRNLSAAPFTISIDAPNEYFDVQTMFKTSGHRQPLYYVLDCCFSVLIIGSLVVFVWRGVWVFLDLVLYPSDPKISAWYSLAIGYGIVFITFALQPVMRWACDRLTGIWRLLLAQIFLFFSFIGTVNAWRGIWQLLDNYFLPDQRALSDWITHGVCFILLALMNCANTVLVRGVFLDAEEPGGKCVIFPVYYIRLYFQKERTKKNQQVLDSVEKDESANTLLLLEKPTNNVVIVKNTNEKNPQ